MAKRAKNDWTARLVREAPVDVHVVRSREQRPATPPEGMRRVSRSVIPAIVPGTKSAMIPPPAPAPEVVIPVASPLPTVPPTFEPEPPSQATLPPGFTVPPPPPAARRSALPTPPPRNTMLPPRRSTVRPTLKTSSHLSPEHPPASQAHRVVAHLIDSAGNTGPSIDLVETLRSFGDVALEVLCQRFPGEHARRPIAGVEYRAADLSLVAGALASFGEPAVPYVAWLLGSDDDERRFGATVVARELPHPDLVKPLGRLVLESSGADRTSALAALEAHKAFPEHDTLMRSFIQAVGSSTTRQLWRLRAIDGLRAMREPLAVGVLIAVLGDRDPQIARAAHGALVMLTGHDYGRLRSPWQKWRQRCEGTSRVEWLLEGLGDSRSMIRALAARELEDETGEALGLAPDAPVDDYVAVQQRFRALI